MNNMMLFAGNATPELAKKVADHLNLPLGQATVGHFSDGETMVEILENVRGQNIFLIQSTSAPNNDTIMELLIMVDALRRASAALITAVIPYFGYARQDKRVRSARVPISAKLIADMMHTAKINRVLTVDLHADQIQGFFDMPVDNVYATPNILSDIRQKNYPNLMIVSPDVGGVVRARAVAKRMNDADLAIIDKRRPRPNQAEVMHVIGDVENRTCVIIDDMVDTAGTLSLAAHALKKQGAVKIYAYCTHPVLSGNAIQNIMNSNLEELVVTNTIPLSPEAEKCPKIRVIDISDMLAQTIQYVHEEKSVSSLFSE
ncbi:MAG: ribose-phosphate pyrophosphokinase [Gammaproteobacteria bacterium]